MPAPSSRAYDLPTRVRTYDADMDIMHPLRHEMLDKALEILPFDSAEPLRALDLGLGTGVFAQRLLEAFPRARVVGVDGAPAMLDLARARLGELAERVEFVAADFQQLPREILEDKPFDVVVSSYALHHLDAEEKLSTLRAVVETLRPHGWLLNADLVVARGPEVEQRIQEVRVEGVTHRAPSGDERFADPGSTRSYLDRLEEAEADQPLPLATDLRILQEAGIEQAEVFWKEYREALIGGPRLAA